MEVFLLLVVVELYIAYVTVVLEVVVAQARNFLSERCHLAALDSKRLPALIIVDVLLFTMLI